jgi:hypothetical protein
MYGYQDNYATQGRGFGKPLRELPDQEPRGVDEPESYDGEESGSELEGDSQPTTSRAKSATSITQVF